ncbi:MAG: TadE family protein [Bacillota bacterium]
MRYKLNENGSVMLEFTLIFPLLIALFLGIVNFAILLNNNIVAASAAREAAHTVAVTGNASTAKAKGEEILRTGLLGGQGTVTVARPVRDGRSMTVDARVDYSTAVSAPGFPALVGQSPWSPRITLAEQTSHYVEYRHRRPAGAEFRGAGDCVWCGCMPQGCQ